ncbi:PQQ-dependent sugar dehydrogenase [Fulvivirga ligni]|uniref:PQQ-dependent sugar dehydrogenase n=1 Tax=Fulvivirga ligni TaxID=2904246 RepID=UPI001F39560D|nr:PQQ-dependent sugar dehydrogenase [Fulvivirga ligni]UII19561.1 PQQ-dependent sugar dehydrogenase [Fulvivirga ligni]
MRVILNICLVSIVFGLIGVSCGSNDEVTDEKDPIESDSVTAPVETLPPNTDYAAAFSGQTRVSGRVTKTAYKVTKLATGLSNPWGMTNLPDGRIIVTEKGGTMRIVSASGEVSSAISGLPAVNSSGQGGLLDVAVDPAFESNRIVYWTFSQDGSGGTATAVGKGRLSDDETNIENAEVIYTAIPEFNSSLHYGGRLVWDGSGNLFVSTGERSDLESRPEAQELDAALGKVLRITTNGEPAEGNPFAGQENKLPEIYSYGHRNVQGLAVHPATGDLWEAEFGPRGGDEVNLIEPGKDYGWPTISYGIEYSGSPIGQGITQQAGMEQPVYYWDPVVSPSGITFYTGSLISEWENNLFLGALSGQHIVRLVIKDNLVVGEERLLASENERFRDVLEGTDGALYAITDSGLMYKIGL